MAMTSQLRYRDQDDDLSSDDSFGWSSDSTPKTKRKTIRKAATSKTSSAKGPIKKAKKPGRKPLESVTVLPSDPKLKRKAQNRAAQRAFRERKEQFVNELQDQMRELQQAKEKREKELSAENARLKRENEKLKEENYLLKDAQFTFQFSAKDNNEQDVLVDAQNKVKSTPMPPSVSPPNTEDEQTLLSSPDMDNQSQANKSMFSCGCEDSSKCGELSDYQGGSTSDSARSMPETSFSTVTETKVPEFTFNTTTTTTDPSPFYLYNGKENPFLTPSSNESDFLLQSEPLPALFGAEMDLFGAPNLTHYEENGELDAFFSEQMQTLVDQDALLKCAPENEKPCKKRVLGMLRRSRGANRSIAQINQDVKSYCPDFDLDQLCEDLKKKITFEPHHTLTEDDVDLFIECIQRHP